MVALGLPLVKNHVFVVNLMLIHISESLLHLKKELLLGQRFSDIARKVVATSPSLLLLLLLVEFICSPEVI